MAAEPRDGFALEANHGMVESMLYLENVHIRYRRKVLQL